MESDVLFHISKSIAENIANNVNYVESIDFVHSLIEARKKGLILVSAHEMTLDIIFHHLAAQGNNRAAEIIRKIKIKQRQKKSLLKSLTKIIYVTGKTTKPRKLGNLLVVSCNSINKSNFLYPPYLLAENLSDCEFYSTVIADNFFDDQCFDLSRLKTHKSRYTGGGGNTISNQYDYYKNQGLDLCLCIADSDRKFPQDGLGDTAKFIVDSDAKNPSNYCEAIIINTYSIENILPIKITEMEYIKDKGKDQIEEFSKIKKIYDDVSWKFLPLKKGVAGADLKSQTPYSNYWNGVLEKLKISTNCCSQDKSNCNCKIVPSLSSKLLASLLSNNTIDWREALSNEENEHMRDTYRKIVLNVKSWLCTGEVMRS